MQVLKHIYLFILFVLCVANVKGQVPADKKYKLFFEKIYLHTDKDLYSAGDDIWFKAYLLNGQNNRLINSSNNLYVELITPEGKICSREIVRLEQGTGNGDFKLSDSLTTGKYQIRAYTNWMLNFGDLFVFKKEIELYNSSTAKEDTHLKIVNKINFQQPAFRFYPEGGSLIEGISSIVAVQAFYPSEGSKIKPVQGAVLNKAGDTISNFVTDTLGMGVFTLLPLKDETYRYTIKDISEQNAVAFPQVLKKGLTISVIQKDTLVNIVINANDAVLDAYTGKDFTLSGKHAGLLYLRKPVHLTGNQTVIRVPKSFFPEGIAELTLYDADNKPHSERLVYVHHESKPSILVQTNKTTYHSRESTTIKLKLNDTLATANLSIAIVDASLKGKAPGGIDSYLLLESELLRDVKYPNLYFDTTNNSRFKQMDILMLTRGWRDFIWRKITDTSIRVSYNVENGFDVSGKVRRKFSKAVIPNMNITLTAFKAKGQKIYNTQTDSAGRYHIGNLQIYGSQMVNLTARNNKAQREGWLLMDSINREPLRVSYRGGAEVDTGTNRIKALKKHELAIKKATNPQMLKEVKITENKPVLLGRLMARPFGYLEQHFTISKKDEYFEALDNWMAHNIKGAIINDKPGVMFVGQGGPAYLKGLMYPHFIVNGIDVIPENGTYVEYPKRIGFVQREMSDDDAQMEVTMAEQYFNLTMDKINKVDFKHLVALDPDQGKTVDVFVLYLDIKAGAFENKDFGVEEANINGYYEARAFYKPVYDAETISKKPDLRTTIHWEPNINIAKNSVANVQYFNADVKGKICIVVQGITDKGMPVNFTTQYEVK